MLDAYVVEAIIRRYWAYLDAHQVDQQGQPYQFIVNCLTTSSMATSHQFGLDDDFGYEIYDGESSYEANSSCSELHADAAAEAFMAVRGASVQHRQDGEALDTSSSAVCLLGEMD